MNVIEYKSNVFSLLMEEPEYAIEVYNVLNGTSYGSDMIEIKKLCRNNTFIHRE